jgi:hypothetical protein
MIVQERLETTSGAATRSTSRPPLGRDHQVPFDVALAVDNVMCAACSQERP